MNQLFELSMMLDNEKFRKVLNGVYDKVGYLDGNEDEYIDKSLVSKGITIIYRDSQYRKKVKVVINSGILLNGDNPGPDKFVRKFDKRISEYFGFKYRMEDFNLSETILSTNIDVRNRENVAAYLKVFKKIGRVKGFSPSRYEGFDDIGSFCLDGNSNGIEFLIYDLENYVAQRLRETDIKRKKLKSAIRESEGILRAEVRLTKPKVIRDYTDTNDVSGQIVELSKKCQDIFLDIFTRIIPFGDFYKKDEAVEIIRRAVDDNTLRRKMLRLVALIPVKKSLYLAQKAMDRRNIEKVMDTFAMINLSPIAISKRHDVKHLKCFYEYLFAEK